MPSFLLESEHGGRVAGVDEVGRGPLAGPVVAAAVMLSASAAIRLGCLLDASKRLPPDARLLAFDALRAAGPDVAIAVAAASVGEIERLNILAASLLAMRRAVARLPVLPELVLVDGNRAPEFGCPSRCVVGGDGLCLSIAAASIVAKVVRDRLMARLAVRRPGYGWERNAGYGTASHRAALLRLGPTVHHRALFGSVRRLAADPDPGPPGADRAA